MLELQKRRLLFCLMFWGIGFPAISWGQTGTSVYQGDWPEYHGGPLAQRYSPLDQIDADNVANLELAWSFSTANFGPTMDFNNPSTTTKEPGQRWHL